MKSVTFSPDSTKGAPEDARPGWQRVLSEALRDPAELCRRLELPTSLAAAAQKAPGRFSLLVPRPYLSRIRMGDPQDPLLLEVLPQPQEGAESSQFRTDPLGEAAAPGTPGLLRKYQGRLLIVTTGSCCVHCRFCFRRHFPYQPAADQTELWQRALGQIAADRSIHEVILSGGDPLMLDDAQLAGLAGELAAIPHLDRLRIHTRLPLMIPQRVTDELLAWLRGTRLTPILVNHINHPAEIDAEVAGALGRLVDAGVPLLNQSVLLRGVNDRVEVLAELCRRLVDLRVLPYYLHQLDRVAGAAHFEVPEEVGAGLIAQLRSRLPGYAVPRYVRETPGGTSKEILA
jgi:EF-P beta-lysylation protein EpmB